MDAGEKPDDGGNGGDKGDKKEKPKVNPFAKMMANREVNKKKDPDDKRIKKIRPPGPKPKGKMWDEYEGWIDDPSAAPPPAAPKHSQPAGRPPKGMEWDGEKGEWRKRPSEQTVEDLEEETRRDDGDEEVANAIAATRR